MKYWTGLGTSAPLSSGMAFGVPDLACLPPASVDFLGGSAAASRLFGAEAGSCGKAAPFSRGLGGPLLADPLSAPASRLPLCWHGEGCPWHLRGCCWWRHASPSLPAAPLVAGPSVKDLAATVACLECQVGVAAVQASALTEELRGLDTKISSAFAVEIVELGKEAEAKFLQLESLFGLSEKRLEADLVAFRQQLDGLSGCVGEDHFLKKADAMTNHLESLFASVQEKITLDFMAIQARLVELGQGTGMRTAGSSLEPLSSLIPCEGGSQLHVASSSGLDDDDVAGGSGFQGGGGGGGDDEEDGCSMLSRPQSAHSRPCSEGDWNAVLSMLPAAELARRFALLPAHLKEDCAGSAEACKAIAAMLPF